MYGCKYINVSGENRIRQISWLLSTLNKITQNRLNNYSN